MSAVLPAIAPPSGGERPAAGRAFVLVAGVPGAGKTTVLARVRRDLPDVTVLDPERYRRAGAAAFGGRLPYRSYRPVVHALHAVTVLGHVLAGPDRPGRRTLVVHEPGTRPRRNAALAGLARARGWRTALVVVDVTRAEALEGQRVRGRVVRARSFEGHWARWTEQRTRLRDAARAGAALDGWQHVRLVTRDDAEPVLRRLLDAA